MSGKYHINVLRIFPGGLAILLILLVACGSLEESEDKKLARVHDKYLLESDLQVILPEDVTGEDSVKLADTYINKWIEQSLIIAKAEENLAVEKKKLERQLNDYRNSLMIYAYEKQLVQQKLDTNVSQEEIEEYYHKNKNNFELKDYIVKVLYVKVPGNAPDKNKVKKWLNSDKDEDRAKFRDYCHRFAANFFYEEDSWLYLDDLLREVPIEAYNKEKFLKSNQLIEILDEEYIYWARILDFRLKNSISPLALEREKIRTAIINQRKLKLINDIKKAIYEDALSKNDFERYDT